MDLHGLGAVMHIVGSLLIVYGQTVVKMAHCMVETSMCGNTWLLRGGAIRMMSTTMNVNGQSGSGSGSSGVKWRRPDGKWRRQWMGTKMYSALGWVLFGVGNVMRFASMRFASQTVLSGLGSLQFVVIPVASQQLLGVRARMSTGIGIVVVLLGNALILTNGPSETKFTPLELRRQWSTGEMKSFLYGLALALVLLHVLWRYIHHRRRAAEAAQRMAVQRMKRKSREQLSIDFGTKEVFPGGTALWDIPGSNEADVVEDPGDPSTLRMFTAALLFSVVSSMVGAWSVLFSKSLTYIAEAMPYSLFDWYSWCILVAFFLSAGFWVRQSDKGLKLYPATLIMPLMQAFWMAMSVLEGIIYFDEMKYLSHRALILLTLGLIMAIVGAVSMGLAGYFNEQKLSHADSNNNIVNNMLVPQKDSSVLIDPEMQLISSAAGGGGDDGRMQHEVGRIDRLSSPALREVVRTSSLTDLLHQELQFSARKNSNDRVN